MTAVLTFPEGKIFTESEEDTLFKIISSDGEEAQLPTLRDLISQLEQDLFKEMGQVHKFDHRAEDLHLKAHGVVYRVIPGRRLLREDHERGREDGRRWGS